MRFFTVVSLAAVLAAPAAAQTRTVRINSKILGEERVLHVTVAAAGYDIVPDVHDYAIRLRFR